MFYLFIIYYPTRDLQRRPKPVVAGSQKHARVNVYNCLGTVVLHKFSVILNLMILAFLLFFFAKVSTC